MPLQTSQPKSSWPEVFNDGALKETLPVQLTSPHHKFSLPKREHKKTEEMWTECSRQVEETLKKQVSQHAPSSWKVKESKRVIPVVYEEAPFTNGLKHTTCEPGHLQSLYCNQCFNEKSKPSQEIKQCWKSTNTAVSVKATKFSDLVVNTGSSNGKSLSKTDLNIPKIPETVIQKSEVFLQRQPDMHRLNMGKKIFPPIHTVQTKNNLEIPDNVVEVDVEVGSLPNTLTDAERHTLKKAVSALRIKIIGAGGKVAKTIWGNNITQALASGKSFDNKSNEISAEIDKTASALIGIIHQTETGGEKSAATKLSPKSMLFHTEETPQTSNKQNKLQNSADGPFRRGSSDSAKVNIQQENQQTDEEKMAHTHITMFHQQHGTRTFGNQIVAQPVIKREEPNQQKATVHHDLQASNPKSSALSAANNKVIFPTGFVKAVLLDTGLLRTNSSIPFISKRGTIKKMSTKIPSTKLQYEILRLNVK